MIATTYGRFRRMVLGDASVRLPRLVLASVVVGVLVGLVAGLRSVPAMQALVHPGDVPAWLWLLPPTWFAAALAPLVSAPPTPAVAASMAVDAMSVAISSQP